MLTELKSRSAGGAAKSGRYNLHDTCNDTARLRFIQDIAFMGLRLGILVPDNHLRMIREAPMAVAVRSLRFLLLPAVRRQVLYL